MEFCRKTILLLIFSSFMSVGWGQCTNEGEIEIDSIEEICNLTDLTEIDLSFNDLTGEIPSCIGNLINLTCLNLSYNQLTGEIPSEIGNLINLNELTLWGNQLTGEIPPEIGNLTNLTSLKLQSNELNGEIPESICDLTINFYDSFYFGINWNNLCPPYLECLLGEEFIDENGNGIWDEGELFFDSNENDEYDDEVVGYQDTSECEEPSLCDEGYTEIDGECYYQSDLDVLQQFIDNSQEGDNPPPSDLSPIELGYQEWVSGRLWTLCSNNDENDYCPTDYELSGNIPDNIGNLTSLRNLLLRFNNLSGIIPESIYNLSNLIMWTMNWNDLSGEFPSEIGNLENLYGLELGGNQLTGEIPPEIGNLTNLTILQLSFNQLSGEIPPEIGNLTNLFSMSVDLSYNQLTGEIPSEICNIGYTSPLLSNNQLCPPYPECLTEEDIGYQDTSECSICNDGYTEIDGECYYQSDLDVLQEFIEFNESLSGLEPQEIGEWTNGRLTQLELWFHNLTTLPESIGDLNSLEFLNLRINQLTTLPESIGNLSNLKSLWLSYNQLQTLPESIGNLSNLKSLWLSSNQLQTLPESIGDLSSLEVLLLSDNQLTHLPESIGFLSILSDLDLSSNQLTFLPESFCNLNIDWNDYEDFLCGDNYICDDIPECIIDSDGFNYIYDWYIYDFIYQPQNCNECILGDINNDSILNVLDIVSMITLILDGEFDECGDVNSDGELNILDVVTLVNIILYDSCNDGEIELWGECYSIENTTEILLPSSELTGEIPESIGDLINLNSLVLYNNQLSGEIPESIENLTNLMWLNLYNNQLTGEIPESIGNLTNLTSLDLGFNQFSGEIPEGLGNLTNLNHLWLYHNQLNGEIPITICNIDSNLEHFYIYDNKLCPPYPECLTEEEIGEQDTSNCP